MHPFQSKKRKKKKCQKCNRSVSRASSLCRWCFEAEVRSNANHDISARNWVPPEKEEDNKELKGHNTASFWTWFRKLMSDEGVFIDRLDMKGRGQLKRLIGFCSDKRCMGELEDVSKFIADNITQLKDTFGWDAVTPGVLLGFWSAIKAKQKKSGSFRKWKKDDWSNLFVESKGNYATDLASKVPSVLPKKLSISSLWRFVTDELQKQIVSVADLGVNGRKALKELCESEGIENVAPVVQQLVDSFSRFQEKYNWSTPFRAQAMVGFWEGIKREIFSQNQGLKEKAGDIGKADYSGYV